MGLRQDFEAILERYGYPTLVLRQDKKVRCSCWNRKTQEADRDFPVCFGMGYTPIAEKHTIREEDAASTTTYTGVDNQMIFGEMAITGREYFFKADAEVVKGDLIIDVEWTDAGRPQYKNGGIYEIAHVDPQRFEKGELVFQKIYCKDQPVEKYIRGIRIVEINGITNYEIAMKE
jgi:hypothetical protein